MGTARKRDCALTGKASARAVEVGFASVEWYHTDVSCKVMNGLMRRNDKTATRDAILWFSG